MTSPVAKQPHTPTRKTKILPAEVLYEFDGPQLFVAQFGFIDAIFVRLDELVLGSDCWLCAALDERELKLIKANQLSVRAAFLKEKTWILSTDANLNVNQFWPTELRELNDDLLPVSGQALSATTRVPDTIEQSESYFSVGFKGGDVSSGTMLFSTLKILVDTAYDVSRKILGPQLLSGSKSGTYDFMVEPQIGSLIISIERPILNSDRINKKLADQGLSSDDMEGVITGQRDEFLDAIDTLAHDARAGELEGEVDGIIRQGFEPIKYVIPNLDSSYGSIEFSARRETGVKTVVIDQVVGARIHRALDRSTENKVERVGVVVEINAESSTFLLKSRVGRLTTCIVPGDFFSRLQEEDGLEIGIVVKVAGNFQRRQRRDKIFVTKYPTVAT